MDRHDKDLLTGGVLAAMALRGDAIAALLLGLILAPAVTLIVLAVFVVGLIGLGLWAALQKALRALSSRTRALSREDARRKALGY